MSHKLFDPADSALMPSRMNHPYYFSPDRALDLGELGEHFAEFQSFITYLDEKTRPIVHITAANVIIKLGRSTQMLDILPLLQADIHELARWADQIADDYLRAKERDWESA